MTRLMARGLGRVIAVVLAVATASWLLAEAAPGSAPERAARAAGALPADDSGMPAALRAEILARVAAEHDLDQPAGARLARYLAGLARGDLGRSWRDGAPVTARLGRAAWPTLALIGLALALAILSGLLAALAAARRPGSALDTAVSAAAALALSLPPVWLALLGLRALADGHPFRVLPASGLASASAWILPVACLALVPAFVIARHARAALVLTMRAPFAVAARARGASRGRVLRVHAARVAAAELTPLLPLFTAYLLGASMVLEEVFGVRGLGALLVTAARHGDAPLVSGVAVIAGALVATASVLADLGQRAADPRIAEP